MKKITIILISICITSTLFAQAPKKMSYQAVIRNINNSLVSNKVVGIRVNILQNSASGTSVYTETQTPKTNDNGLLSIEIGGGLNFNNINWANGTYFIQIETDPNGGTNYSISGTSQLLSVPYAIYSNSSKDSKTLKTLQYLSE